VKRFLGDAMAQYHPSDDGKTIDGKMIVFIYPPASDLRPGSDSKPTAAEKQATAKTQAAALVTAAKAGVPFCEECERARKLLAERARAGK
jgi:hypothetical protein